MKKDSSSEQVILNSEIARNAVKEYNLKLVIAKTLATEIELRENLKKGVSPCKWIIK